VCGKTQSDCQVGFTLHSDTCQCVCDALQCDAAQGKYQDPSQSCACMNCTGVAPYLCPCGNGIVEPGEQCDSPIDPCCQNCQFSNNPCNDSNACTSGDVCDGQGHCQGTYKCGNDTTCNTITCDPAVGVCNNNNRADGSSCESTAGAGDADLCERRCVTGVCLDYSPSPKACVDDNPDDCFVPVCQSPGGGCVQQPVAPGTPCADGDACTVGDQ